MSHLRAGKGSGDRTVAEHRCPIGESLELVQAVGDVEDRLPRRGVAAQRLVEELDLGGRQRRGRLVEQEHAVVGVLPVAEHAGDSHHPHLGRPEHVEPLPGVGIDPVALQQRARAAMERSPADAAEPAEREAGRADEVLGDRQRSETSVILVHEAESEFVDIVRGDPASVEFPGPRPRRGHGRREGRQRGS